MSNKRKSPTYFFIAQTISSADFQRACRHTETDISAKCIKFVSLFVMVTHAFDEHELIRTLNKFISTQIPDKIHQRNKKKKIVIQVPFWPTATQIMIIITRKIIAKWLETFLEAEIIEIEWMNGNCVVCHVRTMNWISNLQKSNSNGHTQMCRAAMTVESDQFLRVSFTFTNYHVENKQHGGTRGHTEGLLCKYVFVYCILFELILNCS